MKLWYQSMTRRSQWGTYPAVLRGILDQVKDAGTEIHVAGITEIGGVGDQYRYLEFLETGEVLKNVHRAQNEGFDAFLAACRTRDFRSNLATPVAVIELSVAP